MAKVSSSGEGEIKVAFEILELPKKKKKLFFSNQS
jgi:hypothetical protein